MCLCWLGEAMLQEYLLLIATIILQGLPSSQPLHTLSPSPPPPPSLSLLSASSPFLFPSFPPSLGASHPPPHSPTTRLTCTLSVVHKPVSKASTVIRETFGVEDFSDSMRKLKHTNIMCIINANVVQGRLSENYLTRKLIAPNIFDTNYSCTTVLPAFSRINHCNTN